MPYYAVSAASWRYKSYAAISGALVEKKIRIGYAVPNVAIVGHTSLYQDKLYHYGPFLATFALTWHFDRYMIKPDRK